MSSDSASSTAKDDTLLDVRNLSVRFEAPEPSVQATSDVSFRVGLQQRFGIIGESGSGKSVTALAILRLLDNRLVTYGSDSSIRFREKELLSLSEKEMARIRGSEISMIFQDPSASLNPVIRIGSQIGDVIKHHLNLTKDQIEERVLDSLALVGLPNPRKHSNSYPHELSGGMRQRALIAMALACEPVLLIADEPTSALDATVQSAILEMLAESTTETGTAVLLITHDMSVVARFCDDVAVMYGGSVVEFGPKGEVLGSPLHPYTRGLFGSIPSGSRSDQNKLPVISGVQGVRHKPHDQCPFYDRCPEKTDPRCKDTVPPLRDIGRGHYVATFCDTMG